MSIRSLFVRGLRGFNFRVFCWVFFGTLALTTVWERLMPRIYESAGMIQFLRPDPQVLINSESASAEPSSWLSERLPTTEEIELGNMVQRMSGEDRAALLRPYGYDADAGGEVVENILRRNLKMTFKRLSLLVIVSYRHPSPEVALKMADLLMEEFVARRFRLRGQEIVRMVEDLGVRLEQQTRVVENLEKEFAGTQKRLGHASGEQLVEFQEAYQNSERRLAVNRELLSNMKVRKERMSTESPKPLLRVVDYPVLAKPDEYVRSPIMKVLRWRWGIAGVVGLMVAGWVRWRQSPRSRSRLRGVTKV